jgi:hypothetical protein
LEGAQPSLPICTLCEPGRVFESHRGLASHMKAHSDAVKCPECSEMVRYLVPHLRSIHEMREEESSLVEHVAELVATVRTLRRENKVLQKAISEIADKAGLY